MTKNTQVLLPGVKVVGRMDKGTKMRSRVSTTPIKEHVTPQTIIFEGLNGLDYQRW